MKTKGRLADFNCTCVAITPLSSVRVQRRPTYWAILSTYCDCISCFRFTNMFQEIEAVREQQLASHSTPLEYIVWRYSWRYFKKGWAFQRTAVT